MTSRCSFYTMTVEHNGIAECRIVLIMKVARTSMIHAADSHFLWLFAVRYAAHQLNLWLRDCEPETSPTLCWMGEVGDASPFWVSTPSGFPPQRSLLPLQLVAADFNAAGGGDSGGVSNICY
ncbi:unnamed protein product [Closterium sp. NIES-54]